MRHETLYALRRPFKRALDVLTYYPTHDEVVDSAKSRLLPDLDLSPCPPPHAYAQQFQSLLMDLILYASAMNLPLNQWLVEAKEAAHDEFAEADAGVKDAY